MSAPNYDRPAFDPDIAERLRKPTKLDRIAAKRQRTRDEDAHERKVNAEVDARDKGRCRCCGRRGNPDALGRLHRAHIIDASLGGPYTPENLCTLCSDCHAAEHAKQLHFVGTNANERIEFEVEEAAVVAIFSYRTLPAHVHIVLPSGERKVS